MEYLVTQPAVNAGFSYGERRSQLVGIGKFLAMATTFYVGEVLLS